MDAEMLREIGMTPAESRVYLALLRLGTAKASPIIRESRLQNSVVHLALTKLIQNGFVTFVRRGKVRYFQTVHPGAFKSLIDEKQARLQALLPELLAIHTPAARQEAEVFEGINGFRSMLYQLIEEGEKGDEFLFFAFCHPDVRVKEEIYSIYTEYDEYRFERGIKIRGIVPEALRGSYVNRKQLRLLFVDFPILHNIMIFRNKVGMTPWGERKVSFLLTSAELAQHFREFFVAVWAAGAKQSLRAKK